MSHSKNNNDFRDVFEAASKGDVEILEYLEGKGLDLNARDKEGHTAVHYAASGGHTETVKYLEGKGLDLNARDKEGHTAVHHAAVGGHTETLEYLEGKGLDLNAQDEEGSTAVHCAAAGGHTKTLEYLEGKGLDLNARDKEGHTAVYYAALDGRHTETSKYLNMRTVGWFLIALAGLCCVPFVVSRYFPQVLPKILKDNLGLSLFSTVSNVPREIVRDSIGRT